LRASYYVRGEKLVNEPEAPLGLAFSEIESSQLTRSHPVLSCEKRGQNLYISVNILSSCGFVATQFRHERELARDRMINIIS
jgi:hypothetical protein